MCIVNYVHPQTFRSTPAGITVYHPGLIAKHYGDLPVTWTPGEIKWERGDLLDSDPDERQTVYMMDGIDEAGNSYTGTGYYYHDELDEVIDIEKV